MDQQLLKGPVPEDVGPRGKFVPASEQLCHNESNSGPLDQNHVLFYTRRCLPGRLSSVVLKVGSPDPWGSAVHCQGVREEFATKHTHTHTHR